LRIRFGLSLPPTLSAASPLVPRRARDLSGRTGGRDLDRRRFGSPAPLWYGAVRWPRGGLSAGETTATPLCAHGRPRGRVRRHERRGVLGRDECGGKLQ
jgi:hypothetical protein